METAQSIFMIRTKTTKNQIEIQSIDEIKETNTLNKIIVINNILIIAAVAFFINLTVCLLVELLEISSRDPSLKIIPKDSSKAQYRYIIWEKGLNI